MFDPIDHAHEPWTLYLDESYQDNLITIAGVALPSTMVPAVVSAWHNLKETKFGVSIDLELKSSYGKKEKARQVLDDAGWTHAKRVPAMLDVVAGLPVVLIANTIVDRRSDGDIVDRYHENLQWCIRRFANMLELDLSATTRGHRVIIDAPPTPSELDGRSVGPELCDFVRNHRGHIPYEAYRRQYFEGEVFPRSLRRGRPLHRLGFEPELAGSHACTADLLQVADVVAGTVRTLVHANVEKPSPKQHIVENFQRVAPLIRTGTDRRSGQRTILTFGFDVYDPQRPVGAPAPENIADSIVQAAMAAVA